MPVRGVSLFYLNGATQDLPWLLANQGDSTVRSRLDNLLAAYRQACVNEVRLIIGADHYPSTNYPVPSSTLVNQVNSLLSILRAGQFKIELVLWTRQVNGLFPEPAPYTNDKTWIANWMSRLTRPIDTVMIGADIAPCAWNGSRYACEGEPDAPALATNHGKWIRAMWVWFHQTYTQRAAYNILGGDPARTFEQLGNSVGWIMRNTPEVPVVAATLYFDLPPGSSWSAYASKVDTALDRYRSLTTKPLWIDEYGKLMGSCPSTLCPPAGATYTSTDQANYVAGFLGATTCQRPGVLGGEFAWIAGNDYPYNGQFWFGLASGFTSLQQPIWRGAWSTISQYYKLQRCP
ncbi:MAG: hypothetical protein HYZ92_06970 [Candidatus Omnitrophica bacterium]|nr:hypothetical protein [Candidatus Omnitrophota bacterium]